MKKRAGEGGRGSQDCHLPLRVSNDGVVHLAARRVGLNVLDPAAKRDTMFQICRKEESIELQQCLELSGCQFGICKH